MHVASPSDVVGVGVLSPYGASANSAWFTTDPESAALTYVVARGNIDAGATDPVVIHRVEE